MSGQLITNTDTLLKDIMNKIMPWSRNLYFLVGYFYFSGFEEIYKNLQNKNLRILVGMDIETTLNNRVREICYLEETGRPLKSQVRDDYFKNLVQSINESAFFDNRTTEEAFRTFINKIKDGSLEIRKTRDPNHAKLYLFENDEHFNQGREYPGTLITGSSNLTHSGLRGRQEINVTFREKHIFQEGMEVFNKLWEHAVTIASLDNYDEFNQNVLEKVWIEKTPKPFLLYLRVLKEYLSYDNDRDFKLPGELSDKMMDLKYQIDAIERGLEIIERHDGVIIADVVGLGKSIIASVIAHNLGLRTIVICPPHLKDQWEQYRRDFHFQGEVYTSGKIASALEDYKDIADEKLIIIDEAHKYKNDDTINYGLLHKLCMANKVILLSATPLNNEPKDIFNMVSLFQLKEYSSIRTVENLNDEFKRLSRVYEAIKKSSKDESQKEDVKRRIKEVGDEIRDLLFPILLRRTRLDLMNIERYKKDLEAQGIAFPKVNPPATMTYTLDEWEPIYWKTVEKIKPDSDDEKGTFSASRYRPISYLKNQKKYKEKLAAVFEDIKFIELSQEQLAKFMKRLLIRRFESSQKAFLITLGNIIRSYELIEEWYDKAGKIPFFKKGTIPAVEALVSDNENMDKDTIFDKIMGLEKIGKMKEKGLFFIEAVDLRKEFRKDLKKDKELLENIKKEWESHMMWPDPKVLHFREHIQKLLKEVPNRKIVVFSEFTDTVDYLQEEMEKFGFRSFSYSANKASKENKHIIRSNFDAGFPEAEQRDEYDILIATDAISEGYNLHRAGVIVNFDIPYNPTRVIQRVGRINRINKKVFDELFIYNYFPTETGERETGTKRISTLKIALFNSLLGADTQILTSEEDLNSYFAEVFIENMKSSEELSWDVEYRNVLSEVETHYPELMKQAEELPLRTRVRRSREKAQSGVLVFAGKGDEYTFKYCDAQGEIRSITAKEALELFKSDLSEAGTPVSEAFYEKYSKLVQRLFLDKTSKARDKVVNEALSKLDLLKEITDDPGKKGYLSELHRTIKEMGAIPKIFMRFIRQVHERSIEEDVTALMEEVSGDYIRAMFRKRDEIVQEKETLILSEELI